MKILILEEFMEHSDYDWLDRRIIALSESSEILQELVDGIKSESKDYISKYNQIVYARIPLKERDSKITELRKQYKLLTKYNVFAEIDDCGKAFVIEEMEVI